MNLTQKLKYSFLTFVISGTITPLVWADTTDELEKRITQLENQLSETDSSESNSDLVIGGAIEVEASYGEDYSGNATSDISVATFELGLSHEISNELSANVTFLYEEDDTPLEVDVATIMFKPWESNFSFVVGQDYLPFGTFETAMVNDPLTLELGETRETALITHYAYGPISAAVYLFNGSQDQNGRDVATQYGGRLAFANETMALALDYISNITDGDALQENNFQLDAGAEVPAGASFSAIFTLETAQLTAEHLRALDPLEGDGNNSEPSANHVEVSFSNDFLNYGLAYQTTDEAQFLGLPKKRISLGFSKEFYHGLSLGIELSQDHDYDPENNGTGEKANNAVIQFATAL